MNVQPVILCGGSGARLWRLPAREGFRKQFLVLAGNESLLSAAGATPRQASHEKSD